VRAALEQGGFTVCAEAGDGQGAVEAALRERPDICLLDVHMPGGGIAAASEIMRSLPRTAVVMLTVSREDHDLFDALRAGAHGYLLKDIEPAGLPLALRSVLGGEAALPRALIGKVFEQFRRRAACGRLLTLGGRRAELTSREGDVLDLLAQGLTTGEIAARLLVSSVTVRRHIGEIRRKLDAPDRDTAVRLFDEASAR
jgi:DNA-binding NarL/FixJ family response regulator